MSVILENMRLLTPEQDLEGALLHVGEDGRICYSGPSAGAPAADGKRVNLQGKIVIPGLVDIHVHGGFGILFGHLPTLFEDLTAYAARIPCSGVTGFLCSVFAPDRISLLETVQAYSSLFEYTYTGAQPLGMHVQGPAMSIEKSGAINPDWLRYPDPEEFRQLIDAGLGWIRQMTLAPELPGAFEAAELLQDAGIVVAFGHSNADYDTASRALNGPWSHVTHVYNAMTSLHHRSPGGTGAVLVSDRGTVELIADGYHVHPAAAEILFRCVGTDRVALVTDAMPGAGLQEGTFSAMGSTFHVRDEQARLEDGTLSGSGAQLHKCVAWMMREAGVPLKEAVQMASLNPARVLGLDRIGSLEVGKDANLVVVDERMKVYRTMVRGEWVFQP
ncbi:MAG: N-acetylglucosamine-6-phosphate deacetylase [Anaerolineales bacterium]|nr:N-acetylglucosamine-6-phosphate deacetylase [Anaerolineales bacterium]